MFHLLEEWLIGLAGKLPLEVFAFFASLVEEVIPPIPSPAVMIVTGSAALVQDYAWPGLAVLVLLAALGKTIGGWIVYFVIDKAEDVLTVRLVKFFGVTHKSIEAFGAKFGRGWRDYVLLFILRSLPVVPSAIISVGCGFLKINKKLFLSATFFGSLIRDSIYIYIGFAGAELFKNFVDKTASIESIVQVVAVLVIGGFLARAWWRRNIKGKNQ